ncbi:MAG: (Fe-S)-binding protein [Alphaproteobacteria bacterium]|nr:(Fe-S)-binding protein [Alphaproteobacteria bacterium]
MADMIPKKKVGLFITCLVDLLRPSVGMASLKLLENAQQNGLNFSVLVPKQQLCCGQPAYNGGDRLAAQKMARTTLALFESFDYVVIPSGSCAGMIKCHYPLLLADDPKWGERAEKLAARVYELTQFLHDLCDAPKTSAESNHDKDLGKIAYHCSCSSLREMKVKDQPVALLQQYVGKDAGIAVETLPDFATCCGFGGLFSVKFPDISAAMADAKIAECQAMGADLLVACDLGCLLHLGGRMGRTAETRDIPGTKPIEVRHIAEILADNDSDSSLNPRSSR